MRTITSNCAERYDPDFKPTEKGYILLATHNSKADGVNASELAKLPGQTFSFEAQVEGEFPESHVSLRPDAAPETGRSGDVHPQRHRRQAATTTANWPS